MIKRWDPRDVVCPVYQSAEVDGFIRELLIIIEDAHEIFEDEGYTETAREIRFKVVDLFDQLEEMDNNPVLKRMRGGGSGQ